MMINQTNFFWLKSRCFLEQITIIARKAWKSDKNELLKGTRKRFKCTIEVDGEKERAK